MEQYKWWDFKGNRKRELNGTANLTSIYNILWYTIEIKYLSEKKYKNQDVEYRCLTIHVREYRTINIK